MKTFVGFRSAHPAAAFLFFAFAFLVSMVSTHPFTLGACFLCAAACDLVLQGKKAVRLLFVLLPMILLISAFNGFYNHYGITVLFVMKNGNNFTVEALIYGLVFAVRVAGAVLWLDAAGAVLSSDKVIFLFGRLSPRLALVISMALRFLPLIRLQSAQIHAAQQGLGSTADGNLFRRLRQAARRFSILVSWTLERGIDTADSMRARGYGLRRRSFYNRFAFSPADLLLTLVTAAATALYFLTLSSMTAVYNPIVMIPAPDLAGIAASAALLAAFVLPTAAELLSAALFTPERKKKGKEIRRG